MWFLLIILVCCIYYIIESKYFYKYQSWNGCVKRGSWEDCPCGSDSWNGIPANHMWSHTQYNYYGPYKKCLLCHSVKTTNL